MFLRRTLLLGFIEMSQSQGIINDGTGETERRARTVKVPNSRVFPGRSPNEERRIKALAGQSFRAKMIGAAQAGGPV
jgi:hypothetical protein